MRISSDGPSPRSQNEGETVEERTAIAKVMQAYAVAIPTEVQGAMDNCGTGVIVLIVSIFQQQLPSSLLVVASRWRKHGNRSISSKSGSADVLGSSKD